MNTLLNPLLHSRELPDFSAIRPEHVGPALDQLLADADTALERAIGADLSADYDTLSMVLDVPVERLYRTWGHVCHLQAVVDTPELRAVHAHNLLRVIDFGTRLGADERLYAKYKAVLAHDLAHGKAHGGPLPSLTPARRKALADALRDFVLGGAELQGAARERFAAIQDRSGALQQQFGDHVLDATEAFAFYASEAELSGVPADVCLAARDAAAAEGRDGYKLTLKAPCYLPLMRYASHRPLREALFRAYTTRASEFGPPELDNSALMRELLELRHEEALLLGHANYGDLSLVPKMASSPEIGRAHV